MSFHTRARPLVGAAFGSLLFVACSSAPESGPLSTSAQGEDASVAAPAATAEVRGEQARSNPMRYLMADGLPPGVARYHGGPQVGVTPTCSSPKLTYFGGPLLQQPIIVPVFWNNTVNATLQASIPQFYADVTQSTYWQWLQEYDSVGLSPGTNQAILPGTVTAGVVLAPVKCNPGGAGCKLTDADLQTELNRQIGLGNLPAPTLDCTGNSRTIYMVHFPANIALTGPYNIKSCVGGGFCAYHGTGTYGASTPLVYGAMMDEFTGGCSTGCGFNATALENSTDTASHELAEATTDTDIGLDVQPLYAAPAAWGDNNNGCGEIGDICDTASPGDTITVSGRTWVVQELWSNAQNKCTSTGPAQTICSGTTVTGCRKCSCGDNGVACSGSTSACETTKTNVLFGGCEQCTSTNDTCSSGTCQQSATPAQDDICVACVPKTTCPAGDNCGTVPDGCGGTVNCGTCTLPQTCGGGTPSNPNVCGCTPKTTCPAGDNCGTVPNGCGGTVSCGSCTAPQTCGGGTPSNPNHCGCTPSTTCPAGDNCGTVPNGCGGTVSCGSCTAPQTCGGGTPSNPNQCGCTPATTCPAGDNCGTVPNGCGGTVNCGTCTAPQTCTANHCGCTPKTTCPAGDNCGTIPDGCGGTVNCGTCTAPQTCGGTGNPNQCGCTPKTTCPAGDNCGSVPDGCGGTVNCGTCAAPQTCGGTGNPNQCGCTPKTTCPAGDNCGTAPDGCGGTVNCGTCAAPQTCGGTGNPNQCGCTPKTTCPAGDNCGTAPDGCGGTVNCGTCSAPQTCGGTGNPNQCGCTPKTTCPAGDNCGTAPDGCGGAVNCGSCAAPQTCGGGSPSNPNVCGCTPATTCATGLNCGTAGDGCGGTISCGTCGSSESCVSNKCVASTPDGGGTTDAGSLDSGTTGHDAGADSGTAHDGGATADSGAGHDSGAGAADSSTATGDGAAADAADDASDEAGAGATPGANGGCGCKMAGAAEAGPSPGLVAFGILALVGGLRLRRRGAVAVLACRRAHPPLARHRLPRV